MRRFSSLLISLAAVASGSLLPAPCQGQDVLPAGKPAEAAPAADSPEAFRRQVSYCLGLDFGERLKADSVEVDYAAIAAGLRDALSGAAPQLSPEQMNAVMERFQRQMQAKAEEANKAMSQAAVQAEARGAKYLAENRSKEGVVETPSGLQYRVVEPGKGESPGPTDTVRCNYEGRLLDGKVFDSSYKRGEPAEFPVDGVIEGWTEALQMMKPGAKWEVALPAKIAYKNRGAGGLIGPGETLLFTIELIDVVE